MHCVCGKEFDGRYDYNGQRIMWPLPLRGCCSHDCLYNGERHERQAARQARIARLSVKR